MAGVAALAPPVYYNRAENLILFPKKCFIPDSGWVLRIDKRKSYYHNEVYCFVRGWR